MRSSHPNSVRGQIDVPSQCRLTASVVESVFPDFSVDRSKSVIVTPLNDDADRLNDRILTVFDCDAPVTEYRSIDTVVEDESNQICQVTTEFLNSLTPSGMPPHRLRLKPGCSVMLIRNLDSSKGCLLYTSPSPRDS